MLTESLEGAGYIKTKDGDILPSLHLLAEDKGQYTEYKIWGTSIKGLLVWDRKSYLDLRGSMQDIRYRPLSEILGRKLDIQQTLISKNNPFGVLRGLHAEPIDKVVTPVTGKFFIAIADIRPDSTTFGKYVIFILDQTDPDKATKSIVISNGLANSFLTIGTERGIYVYASSAEYKTSDGKRQVKWNDPDLAIPWPITPTLMSTQDEIKNPSLRELFPEKFR